jgi:hypothetical protein
LGVKALGIDLITFLSGANLIGVTVQCMIGSGEIASVAAFLGIATGSMCVFPQRRVAASLALTLILSLVYQSLWYYGWSYHQSSKHGNSPLVVSVVAGGIAAFAVMLFAARRSSKNQ